MTDKAFDVFIEISQNSDIVKYEHQKNVLYRGLGFRVTRIVDVTGPMGPLKYPANYGYIPKTIAGDRDEVDAFVWTPFPLIPGSIIECRALGMIDVEDQNGHDPKIFAVPVSKVTPRFDEYHDFSDLPNFFLHTITQFLETYKTGVPNCWSTVLGWHGKTYAYKEINKGIANYLEREEQLKLLD